MQITYNNTPFDRSLEIREGGCSCGNSECRSRINARKIILRSQQISPKPSAVHVSQIQTPNPEAKQTAILNPEPSTLDHNPDHNPDRNPSSATLQRASQWTLRIASLFSCWIRGTPACQDRCFGSGLNPKPPKSCGLSLRSANVSAFGLGWFGVELQELSQVAVKQLKLSYRVGIWFPNIVTQTRLLNGDRIRVEGLQVQAYVGLCRLWARVWLRFREVRGNNASVSPQCHNAFHEAS